MNRKSTTPRSSTLSLIPFRLIVLTVFLAAGGTNQVAAQSMGGSTPIAMAPGAPAGSYQLGTFDSVNYYSGSINFNVPLLTIGGRGGVQIPVSVPITRRPWHVEYWTETVPYQGEGEGERHYYPTTQWWSAETRLGIPVLAARRVGYPVGHCPDAGSGYDVFGYTLTRLTFTAPDGTEYELRDTATGGQPFNRSTCSLAATSRGTVFATADGGSAVFTSDAAIYDPVQPPVDTNYDYPSGYLVLRDGTKYRIDYGVPTWVMDRNGNKITYVHQNSLTDTTTCQPALGPCTTFITDPLKRVVIIDHDGYDDVITYKGYGGEDRTIRVEHCNPERTCLAPGFSGLEPDELFPELRDANTGPVLFPDMITSIELPNGQSYEFRYNPYGELARVELPTGGIFTYEWDGGFEADSSGCTGSNGIIYRRIVRRDIYSASSALENMVTIGRLSSTGYVDVETLDNSYATINATRHYYWGDPAVSMSMLPTEYPSWKEGKEYKTEVYTPNWTTLLRKTEQTWANTTPSWWGGSSDAAPSKLSQVTETTNTIADVTPNLVAAETYAYDSYGNLTDTYSYDFGSGSAGSLLRRSHTDYVTSSNYTSYSSGPYLISLPSENWVSSDSSGTYKVSLTQYEYDNYSSDSLHAGLVNRSSITGHDSAYDTSKVYRGNVTKVTTYANAGSASGAIYAAAQYDIAGNVWKTIDPRGNATTIYYDDCFGAPNANAQTNTAPSQLSGNSTFAFPTSSTMTINSQDFTSYTQFDYFTGKPVDAKDINGSVTSAVYDDDLDRQTQVIVASNVDTLMNQTTIAYDDTNRKVTVTGDLRAFDDNLLKSESFSDGFGRTTETRKYDVTTYSAVRTEYDALGRAYKSSNPFRPALSETPVWTVSAFDTLGRVTSVTTPDSAVLAKAYSGNQTTVTDQAGKKRRGFANALGQTIKVVEDPDTLAYETTYLFDAAGNLRKTSQGTSGQMQYRFFSYDSLGRLLRSKQPEQGSNSGISFTDSLTGNSAWAESFTYDENGNMLTKTDARGVVTTLTYDALNRPLTKNFSDTTSITPDVTMTYDDSGINYSKGHLTAVASPASTTNFTSFDRLGRVTGSSQTMAGVSTPYSMSYTYGRNGALLTETYPSGRVVTNTVDDAGQLSKVSSQEASQTERTYAQNFVYNSADMIERLRLGNSRWESYQYNNRLQVTQIGLGASAGDTSLLKLNFEYNTSGNHDNNGALLKQNITLPGTTTVLTQTYTYDALNRLQSATEMFGSSQSWKQTFAFDRFGNRTFNTSGSNTTTLPSSFDTDIYNPAIDTANNRYTSTDYSYDAAGNVTANAAGQSFVYDAEQHQIEVKVTSTSATVATYKYDGTGQRVKKIVGTEETIFIYDAMGKSVAEYVLNPATTPDVRTRYLTQDQLGSPRVVTDGTGQVQERHDYLAYGEEAGSSLSTVRTTAQKYAGASAVRKRYTGYERDDESGLDYAQARYYNNAHGRFTSVDPLTASATIKNPQTFNRYSYCLNSPYKFTDPLGLKVQYSGVNDPEVAGMDQDQTHDPNPVATESATLVIPTLHGVIAVTVKVYQINNPDIGISDVKGSQQLNVGVDLVFELTGPDGKPIKGTATEHVERLEGEPINQNESTVPLVQGRGKDLVSNPAGAPPRDAVAERAALDKLNKNFITKQRFNLDVVTDGGAHIRVTQVRTLTNEVRGAPSIARGAIRGYTFTMEKPTISLVPQ